MENIKFCTSCGAKINSAAVVCPGCGVPCSGSAPVAVSGNVSSSVPSDGVSPYSKTIVLLLCFFLGGFGVHQFYVGNSKAGITRLVLTLLLGIGGIITLVDFIKLLCGTFKDGEGRIVGLNPASPDSASSAPAQPVQTQTAPASTQPVQTQAAPQAQPVVTPAAPVDEGGFLWGLVGYIISIFGIVLFFVMKKRTPKRAKAILTGSLINIGIALLAGVSAGTYTYLRNKALREAWAAEQAEEERRRQEYIKEQERLQAIALEKALAEVNSMLSRESSSTSTYTESESSQDNDSMGSSLSEGSYMKVKENLRLRSAASTSSNVVTSMQAGSPVEVVTIGDSETVDGVSSYWVLVTTRAGAKDKDGNSISEGTVGWCFAGFLE